MSISAYRSLLGLDNSAYSVFPITIVCDTRDHGFTVYIGIM